MTNRTPHTDRQMLEKLLDVAAGAGCGCLSVQPLLCVSCSERLQKAVAEARDFMVTHDSDAHKWGVLNEEFNDAKHCGATDTEDACGWCLACKDAIIKGLAERVGKQSEILSRRAEQGNVGRDAQPGDALPPGPEGPGR